MTSYGISFFAGALSTLSPCVFPLVPIVVGRAIDGRKLKPLFFVLGTVFTFVTFGLLLGSTTSFFGFDPETIKTTSMIMLMISGVILVSEKLQNTFSALLTGLGSKLNSVTRSLPPTYGGDFLLGSFMGLAWGPCTGPLVGSALASAATGDLYSATLTMLFYGMGFGVPVLVISYVTTSLLKRKVNSNFRFINASKKLFGVLLVSFSLLSILGIMTTVEAWILDLYPMWLIELVSK